MHVHENYRWFFEWSITLLVQQRWHVLMQVFSSQSISYTHIFHDCTFFCHQEALRYGIKPFILSILWKKILVTFVMIYKKCASSSSSWKKILLKSWQIFNVLDWTDWQFKRSKANITLPKDQLKIVLCVCVLLAANVQAGKNCCYLAPAKKFFSNYSN